MKYLLTVLFSFAFSFTSVTIFAKAKSVKAARKMASLSLDKASLVAALNENKVLNQAQNMVNQLSEVISYKCAEIVEKSEIKSFEIFQTQTVDQKFKFVGVKMCFDTQGPGVIEVRYDGLVVIKSESKLAITSLNINLVQDSND